VILLAGGGEEVLDHIQQVGTGHGLAQFFRHLSHHRDTGVFAWFTAAAWQGPEGVALQAVQQPMACMHHHGGSTQWKAVVGHLNGNRGSEKGLPIQLI